MKKVKIHKISHRIVSRSVNKSIKDHAARYKRDRKWLLLTPQSHFKPENRKPLSVKLKELRKIRSMFIREERIKYSKVRVMEVLGDEKPFYLIYSDSSITERSGTGGFKTIDEAIGWFSKSGR